MNQTDRDDAGRRDDDRGFRIERRVFVGIGMWGVGSAFFYWLLGDENAGTVMFALAGGLGLTIGLYLAVKARDGAEAPGEAEEPAEPWFPHSSWWPFGVGVGGWLVCNGLILGTWALIPGLMVLTGTAAGFVAQTRTR